MSEPPPPATPPPGAPGQAVPPATEGPDARLELAQGALLAGFTRLVPVPFVDDYLLRLARARLVRALFAMHGRAEEAPHAAPLWQDPWSCLDLVLWVVLFPLRLVFGLLKKLLKTLFFFLALRDVALVVGHELMLGRAVDRALRSGKMGAPGAEPGPTSPLWVDAQGLRAAFEVAFAGSDRRVLWQMVLALLRGARDLGAWGADAVRRLVRRAPAGAAPGTPPPAEAALPPAEAAALSRLSASLAEMLRRPEVVAYLEDLDRRVEAGLTRPPPPGSPPPP